VAEDILAVVLIFGGGTLFLLAMSPIGRALADRIRGAPGAAPAAPPELLEEVNDLRRQVAELAERLDFAERMLAERRERQLGGGQ